MTADILGFPHGSRPGDYLPSDVEPPCEGNGTFEDALDKQAKDDFDWHIQKVIEGRKRYLQAESTVADPVRHPSHYVQNGVEAIDIIEHVVASYSDPIEAGLVWQILKYLIRAPHKGDKVTDLRKGQFYYNRLVNKQVG